MSLSHRASTFVFLFTCVVLAVRGSRGVTLQPIIFDAPTGTLVNFTCSMPCTTSQTHTMKWLVGHSARRIVDSTFTQRTGISVNVTVSSRCDGAATNGKEIQILSILASSVDTINKTAIQCFGARKNPHYSDLYSAYSMLLINEPQSSTTNSAADSKPDAAQPLVTPSKCEQEKETIVSIVTTTVTVKISETPNAKSP